MEKALGLSSSDDLPAYSDNLSYTSPTSLPQNLASVRIARIYSLIETHIKPHLLDTTLAGLSSTTLVLIPSDVPSLTPSLANDSTDGLRRLPSFPDEIVGFLDAANLTLIHLQGQENSFEFWRQLPVIKELERALQAQLKRENDISDVEESALPAVPESRGWFKKKASSVPPKKTEKVKASGGSKVKSEVELQDVSLRTENAMGLYETKTGKAIVIKVDFNV